MFLYSQPSVANWHLEEMSRTVCGLCQNVSKSRLRQGKAVMEKNERASVWEESSHQPHYVIAFKMGLQAFSDSRQIPATNFVWSGLWLPEQPDTLAAVSVYVILSGLVVQFQIIHLIRIFFIPSLLVIDWTHKVVRLDEWMKVSMRCNFLMNVWLPV